MVERETNSPIREQFGAALREYRRKNYMAQEDLGKILGISRVSVNMYERGKVNMTVDRMMEICNRLDIKIDAKFTVNCNSIGIYGRTRPI